ncbi:MAG: hypothetical protein MUC81_14315 [Bacteroidia bacterium]|nr:hypothetical protein [Bacteroidia bacterium]
MKTFIRLMILLCVCFAISCDKEETKPITNTNNGNTGTTATAPAFDASVASTTESITDVSFKISSTLKENGGSAITQHGHVWSDTKTDPTIADSKTELGATTGPFPLKFTSEIKNLKANTTYNVRAYATNDKGTTYGAVVQAKTVQAVELVKFGEIRASIIKTTSSSIQIDGGQVEHPNGAKINEVGFCYSETNTNPTVADSKAIDKVFITSTTKVSTSYNATATGLKSNTSYNIRPFSIIDDKVYYSTSIKIQTEKAISSATLSEKATFPANVAPAPIYFTIDDKFFINAVKDSRNMAQWWMYDLKTDKWIEKAEIPLTANVAGGIFKGGSGGLNFTHKGKGYFGLATGIAGFTATKSLLEYDPETDKWKEVAQFPSFSIGKGSYTTQAYVNGKVYAYAELANKIIVLDMANLKITEKIVPTNFDFTVKFISFNNQLYAIKSNGEFMEFDASNDKWITKKKVFSFGTYATIANKLYALNGSKIHEYVPASETWNPLIEVPRSSTYFKTFEINFELSNRLFTGLGANGSNKSWFEFKP